MNMGLNKLKTPGASTEEMQVEDAVQRNPAEEELRGKSYEHGLPEYLQQDLDAFKEGLKNGSSLMDCLWGELYGSINVAEINDGIITGSSANIRKSNIPCTL